MKERKELIRLRMANKKEIYKHHLLFSQKITASLKNSVDNLFISIKYLEGRYSPEFENTLKDLMGWRTSQVPKAKVIAQNINVYDFVQAIKTKNYDALSSIKYNNNQLLSPDEIKNMFYKLNEAFIYEDLECISYDDLPQISVTKYVENEYGKSPIVKKISQLSLGQQQSILLSILLLSDSERPLLIDQPEDNLDSEFIYKTIVGTLRKIKEYRQVIIVTHNPNIAVLGDAELIIPLKSTNRKSISISSGSIDNENTIKLCCQILEGGESAFKQRKNIYGF